MPVRIATISRLASSGVTLPARIVEVRHQHRGGEPRGARNVAHGVDVDADRRMIGDFDDFQAQVLDHLQQTEVRRRFDQHRVAGLAQHLQRQRDRIHRAAGDDDVRRIGRRAADRHALGDLAPQLLHDPAA